MLREFLPLGASIEMPAGFDLKVPMTPDGIVGVMNVAIEGEWMGHPSGPFAMDADKMLECCERFDAQANPMLVDYEHSSLGAMGPTPAAGWIHALNIGAGESGAELWATVEWTARAAEMIRSGEYRYCSPVIDFGAKDRATGEHVPVELFNVAITNQPFLDGMHPIALSRVVAAEVPPQLAEANGEGGEDEDEKPPAEGEGEGSEPGESEGEEGESASEEEIPPPAEPSGAEQLTAFLAAVMAASGGSKASVIDALNTLSDEFGGRVRSLLDTTDGSASDAQEIPMSDKPETTETKDSTRDVLAVIAEQQAVILSRLNASEAQAAADKKAADERAAAQLEASNDARVDAMMTDGRLAEHERVTARKLLGTDAGMFEAIYGKRVAGSASPVNRRQVDDSNDGPRIVAKDSDVDLKRDLESLSETELAAYKAIVAQRKDPKATLRRLINSRGSAQPARRAATVAE